MKTLVLCNAAFQENSYISRTIFSLFFPFRVYSLITENWPCYIVLPISHEIHRFELSGRWCSGDRDTFFEFSKELIDSWSNSQWYNGSCIVLKQQSGTVLRSDCFSFSRLSISLGLCRLPGLKGKGGFLTSCGCRFLDIVGWASFESFFSFLSTMVAQSLNHIKIVIISGL